VRVLIVEDEPGIRDVLRRGLQEARFDVDTAADGEEGLRKALSQQYDAVVLDLMLPKRDGWQVCRTIRERRRPIPILMLTARDELDDRVRGLDLGADDYLCKPFEFPEVVARLRALIRRERVNRARVIRVADLEIDTGAGKVRRGGAEIHLTPREYSLLEALAANEGRVVSREAILERVWRDDQSFSNTVDVHVGLLRKKIDAGRDRRLIHTVHGRGYVLEDRGE
jgi:two-component system copper resistance phosphate regulon response regulator CusR